MAVEPQLGAAPQGGAALPVPRHLVPQARQRPEAPGRWQWGQGGLGVVPASVRGWWAASRRGPVAAQSLQGKWRRVSEAPSALLEGFSLWGKAKVGSGVGSGVSSGALGWDLGHRAEIGLTGVISGLQGWDLGRWGEIWGTGVGSGALGPAEAWEQGKPAALPAMTAGEWQLGEPLPPGGLRDRWGQPLSPRLEMVAVFVATKTLKTLKSKHNLTIPA